MTAALCQSRLKSIHFKCVLYTITNQILGESSQIQILNSIKFNLNIYTSKYSCTFSLTILLFSSSLIQHISKNVLHMSIKLVTKNEEIMKIFSTLSSSSFKYKMSNTCNEHRKQKKKRQQHICFKHKQLQYISYQKKIYHLATIIIFNIFNKLLIFFTTKDIFAQL